MNTKSPITTFLLRYWLQLILITMVVTRLPLLWNGYGSDPDAWRVANVGYTVWTTGSYEMSRPPGYPLHELISAPLVALGGSLLSNTATIVATLILIVAFARWAASATQNPPLATTALAFLPLLWMNSAMTMDYVWSLLFIVLSLSALDRGRTMTSAVFMGIAAGFRLSNIVVAIAFCIMIWMEHRSPKRIAQFLLGSIVTTIVAFIPVVATYGFAEWLHLSQSQLGRVRPPFPEQVLLFGYRIVYSVGLIAFTAVVWVFLANRKKIRQLIHNRDVRFVVYATAVFVLVAQFFFLPLDRSYLLPALLFILLIVERVAAKGQFVVFVLTVVSFAFINIDLIGHTGVERGRWGLTIKPGVLFEEITKRNKQLRNRESVAFVPLKGKSIVMTGTDASFWFENPFVERDTAEVWKDFTDPVVRSKRNRDVAFTSVLSREELRIVKEIGYSVYCVEEMKDYIESVVGYTLQANGISLITP